MKKVELFDYPVTKAGKEYLDESLQQEMSDFELSFLCGLIKEKKPRKILELGVAAGGSTAIIVECLGKLGIDARMFSVDISEKYYRNQSYSCGYKAQDIIKESGCVTHSFLLGHSIPHFIEQIGEGIDFLILDTAHMLPGELLDFITVLPFLEDGCIVVLHDVNAGHYQGNMKKIATTLLYNGVSSKDKYRMDDASGNRFSFSNIAAFAVDMTMRENIEDIVQMLLIPWSYSLADTEQKKYLKIISRFYSKEIVSIIERCFLIQDDFLVKQMISSGKTASQAKEVRSYIEQWKKSTCIFVYGAGHWARKFISFARENSLPLDGCVVSEGHKKDEVIDGVPVYELNELTKKSIENPTFVLGVEKGKCEEIREILERKGFYSVLG